MLASDDLGRAISPDDSRIDAYRRALAPLVNVKCRETPRSIALYAWNTRRVLRRDVGLRYTNLRILRNINRAIPRSAAPTRCADAFAAWVILVENP